MQVEFLDGCLYCVAVAAGHSGLTIFPHILRRTYLVFFWKLSRSGLEHARDWLSRMLHRLDTWCTSDVANV